MEVVEFKACFQVPFFQKKPVLPWPIATSKPYELAFLRAEGDIRNWFFSASG